ncbi:uncharacterized protein PHALS_07436 [Plasmopara halstedii]|uniref:Uncharacterized protein n=1 Tax=Plasmopara halstedii TaxID=4781 RepID=A0A0P1B4J8_PLAHL|nr:uncharacterized protein PHALS_07436 [Plasmopara halstedii]CEG49684.1 hypothetical protein PHALS_07436 [Plasmopara halstedii]|eukprot:XP_024586053.1 hypothetical protein PHALS_07436 [Plasmopara halstedii]
MEPVTDVKPRETLGIPVDEFKFSKNQAGKATSEISMPSSQAVSDESLGSTTGARGFANALALCMLLITLYSFPMHQYSHGHSGFGALPFYWIRDVDKLWLVYKRANVFAFQFLLFLPVQMLYQSIGSDIELLRE